MPQMIEDIIPRRERRPENTWDLSPLCPSDELWEKDFTDTVSKIDMLGRFSGKLSDRNICLEALKTFSQIERMVEKLVVYARMRRDEDNAQPKYQAFTDRAKDLLVKTSAATAYLVPELISYGEEYIASLASDPAFSDFSERLHETLRRIPHTLGAEEERLLALTGEIASAPENIYQMLSDADMKFPVIDGENGKPVEITHSNYISLMMSRDRRVRKTAYRALYGTYKAFSSTIAATYAASVKSDIFSAHAARFDTSLEAALFPDSIPAAVYDNLIDTVHRHLPALNRLVIADAKYAAGLDKPAYYDLYTTPKYGFDISLPFDDALELVIDSLRVFGSEYTDQLRTARRERWIDCYENIGKTSGAYSWGTYDSHPYVLMNYKRDYHSVSTLAHELGHAMHSWYSNRSQCYEKSGYSLFIAEVASTVNEVMLVMELLSRHTEKQERLFLLYHLLNAFRSTLYRQTLFAEFEKESHRMAETGEPLTWQSLNALHDRLNRLYYPSCEPDEWIGLEWMRIPHFYRAFYVYKYATGFSAATAIVSRIRADGESAVRDYKSFLSAGSSLPPLEALKLAGVDMSYGEPVDRALRLFEELLTEYESLALKT